MGSGIAHVCALAGFDVLLNDVASRRASRRASPPSTATWPARSPQAASREDERRRRCERISAGAELRRSRRLRPGDRGGDRERGRQAQDLHRRSARRSSPTRSLATNTSSISITRLAAVDRPAGALHRHPFHEPGAGDGAGRADPRHRHRRRDLRDRPRLRRQARQDDRRCRRISRPSSSTASCCR